MPFWALKFRGHYDISKLLEASDPKPFHPRFEGGRLNIQNLGCTTFAPNTPTHSFQYLQDVVPLDGFKCLSLTVRPGYFKRLQVRAEQ